MPEVQVATQAAEGSAPQPGTTASEAGNDQQQVQQVEPQTTEATSTTQQQEPPQQQASQTTVPGSEPEEASAKMQKELQNLRRRTNDAERRAERLEREADARNSGTTVQPTQLSGNQQSNQTPTQAPVVSGDKSPDISDFSDINEFVAAKVKFEVQQAKKTESLELEQKSQKDRQDTVNRDYNRKVNKVLDRLPDFHDVLDGAEFLLPIPVLEAIKESDMGPEIAYHLAKNVDEADRLAKLSPLAAVREIGKIEAKLSAPLSQPKTKQVTQAPEPIRPTPSQASSTKKTLDEMNTDEFMAVRNAELAKRRTRHGNPNW